MKTVFDSHVDPELVERSLSASSFHSVWLDIPRTSADALSDSVTADLLVVKPPEFDPRVPRIGRGVQILSMPILAG